MKNFLIKNKPWLLGTIMVFNLLSCNSNEDDVLIPEQPNSEAGQTNSEIVQANSDIAISERSNGYTIHNRAGRLGRSDGTFKAVLFTGRNFTGRQVILKALGNNQKVRVDLRGSYVNRSTSKGNSTVTGLPSGSIQTRIRSVQVASGCHLRLLTSRNDVVGNWNQRPSNKGSFYQFYHNPPRRAQYAEITCNPGYRTKYLGYFDTDRYSQKINLWQGGGRINFTRGRFKSDLSRIKRYVPIDKVFARRDKCLNKIRTSRRRPSNNRVLSGGSVGDLFCRLVRPNMFLNGDRLAEFADNQWFSGVTPRSNQYGGTGGTTVAYGPTLANNLPRRITLRDGSVRTNDIFNRNGGHVQIANAAYRTTAALWGFAFRIVPPTNGFPRTVEITWRSFGLNAANINGNHGIGPQNAIVPHSERLRITEAIRASIPSDWRIMSTN